MTKTYSNRRAIIAEQIKKVMSSKGMTRKQLADAMGRNPSEVTKWLGGNHNFTIDLLSQISEALGTQITGVIDDSPGNSFLHDETRVNSYNQNYTVVPISLPGDSLQNLEKIAKDKGEELSEYIQKLLIKEAGKPYASAFSFCGIWNYGDFDMTPDEQINDIKSHRSIHKKIVEL